MSKIHLMDEILANKIAAGEVVEKCVSVVKELVENSIDAKASIIKVELKDAGTQLIKVTDNGIGMDEEDINSCIRITFSGDETTDEIQYFCDTLKKCVNQLRMFSE